MKKTIRILGFTLVLACLVLLSFMIYQKYQNDNYSDDEAIEVWEERQESFKKKDTVN